MDSRGQRVDDNRQAVREDVSAGEVVRRGAAADDPVRHPDTVALVAGGAAGLDHRSISERADAAAELHDRPLTVLLVRIEPRAAAADDTALIDMNARAKILTCNAVSDDCAGAEQYSATGSCVTITAVAVGYTVGDDRVDRRAVINTRGDVTKQHKVAKAHVAR